MPYFLVLLQKLRDRARAERARRSVRDSAVTLAGSLVRLALGVLVARLLARGLGPERLGSFYVVSSAVLILGTLSDGGLSLTAVRRIAGLRAEQPGEVPRAAAAALALKLAFAGL